MKNTIIKELLPYVETFASSLAVEHEKVKKVQKSLESQITSIKENEQNRVVAHQQAKESLLAQEKEYREYKEHLAVKEREIELEKAEYNAQKKEFEKRTKEVEDNLAEIKNVKAMSAEQLQNNKKIEDTYRKKLEFLKKDDARIDKMQKDANAKESSLDMRGKMLDDREYELAQVRIKLDERSDFVKISEKQLKIKQAQG